MDAEKKSEVSREDTEQLGPYQLQEQVPQSERSQGELYLAKHETSGAAALVLKPSAGNGAAPLRDWRVRCVSSASLGYFALEVEHSSWSVAPDRHSVESLVCTFEEVREGVLRVARAFSISEPRPWRRLGPVLAGAAVVGALLFALRLPSPESPSPGDPAPLAGAAPVRRSHDVRMDAGNPEPFTNGWLADTTPEGQPVLARPLPREPFKGQKRPPCIRYTEVEIIGACWAPHKLKAPCPDSLYEYKGECYLPSFSAKQPLPQSLGQ